MPLPMIGTWSVTVRAARPFAIHGDQYVELHVTKDDDGTGHVVRVPEHALRTAVPEGARVTVTFLMGQVTEVA